MNEFTVDLSTEKALGMWLTLSAKKGFVFKKEGFLSLDMAYHVKQAKPPALTSFGSARLRPRGCSRKFLSRPK